MCVCVYVNHNINQTLSHDTVITANYHYTHNVIIMEITLFNYVS